MHVVMCGVLPHSENIHPNFHQFRRRLNSNELETWNENGKCLNYRLNVLQKIQQGNYLHFFQYLPISSVEKDSVAECYISVWKAIITLQILKFTKQIRVQASAEFTTEATKSTPKPRKYACKDAHKFETKAAPESTPFSCNYGSRFRILQDPSVRQFGGGSPQPESTVFSTVDPTSSICELRTQNSELFI